MTAITQPTTTLPDDFKVEKVEKADRYTVLVTATAFSRAALTSGAAADAAKDAAQKEGHQVRGLADMPYPRPQAESQATDAQIRFVAQYKLYLNV